MTTAQQRAANPLRFDFRATYDRRVRVRNQQQRDRRIHLVGGQRIGL
jgi:hypothetical protein